MKSLRLLPPLAGAALALSLTACGGGSPATSVPITPQSPPTTLTGNWIVTGSRTPAVSPFLAVNLVVSGNQVYGQGSFSVNCTASFGFGTDVIPFTGTIAADGTFKASATTTLGVTAGTGSYTVALSGNSPTTAAPTVWTGNFSIGINLTLSNGQSCNYSSAADFAATPLTAVTGTYTGAASSTLLGFQPFGPGATVSLQITQGAPVMVTKSTGANYQVPLSATLAIASSTCPYTGTATAAGSYLFGDSLELAFPIANNATGYIYANPNDATSASLTANLAPLAFANGCGNGIVQTTLTRK